jgi:hypothetical protein
LRISFCIDDATKIRGFFKLGGVDSGFRCKWKCKEDEKRVDQNSFNVDKIVLKAVTWAGFAQILTQNFSQWAGV